MRRRSFLGSLGVVFLPARAPAEAPPPDPVRRTRLEPNGFGLLIDVLAEAGLVVDETTP